MHLTRAEVLLTPLRRLLPSRASRKRAGPGVTGQVEEEKWHHKDLELTELEQQLTIATVVKIAVVVMMNTHLYFFNWKFYLQSPALGESSKVSLFVIRRMVNISVMETQLERNQIITAYVQKLTNMAHKLHTHQKHPDIRPSGL